MRLGRAVAALLILLIAGPVRADIAGLITGNIDGADYMVSMPDKWNGGLILFAHGYEGEREGRGSLGESHLSAYFKRGNYAWAASGFRSAGYRPDWFLADTLALRQRFIAMFGQPRWIILYGNSMGGHVTVAALEQHPDLFQGGMTECGVVDGVGHIDWTYAYTAAAEYFSGVPLLDAGPEEFANLVHGPFVERIGVPGRYTERGRRFDSVVKHLAGGDVPLREAGLKRQYLDILRARHPGAAYYRDFARYADTRVYKYEIDPGLEIDAATLNRDIRRVTPEIKTNETIDPVYRPFTGRLRTPLLTLHGTADFDVPLRLEQNYRRKTIAAGASNLLVQRTERMAGHCDFSPAAREKMFDDLVSWIERGVVPKGEDLLGDVSRLGAP
jgi:pimeloyl-ACP methyl ester carboxylesterase